MKQNNTPIRQQPAVVKYSLARRLPVQSILLHRHAIGYVLHGRRCFHNGDVRLEAAKGSVYYLGAGNHYIEDVPDPGKTFEQIVFYFDAVQINNILNNLSINYHMAIDNSHACPNCSNRNEVIQPAENLLREFFRSIEFYLDEDRFTSDKVAENIKMTELVYLLLNGKECCLKACILNNADASMAGLEQVILDNVFNDLSIDELAKKCNRSVSSLKNDFKKHFNVSPHKWFVRQRLLHARLQVISTNKPIAEVGKECGFPNTSHFIKLFKAEYKHTPANYRRAHEKVAVER